MGPGRHQRPISSAKISKAAGGSTATSTVTVTTGAEFMDYDLLLLSARRVSDRRRVDPPRTCASGRATPEARGTGLGEAGRDGHGHPAQRTPARQAQGS